MKFRAISAAICGNILEWYDFMLYGAFAPILSQLFFPYEDRSALLIATFGTFAAGFIVRPIGGLLLGNLGDKVGSRHALIWSVILMAFPTFIIGCLPTYTEVGLLAPILLISLRIIQGLSVGGELPGVIVFLAESARPKRRALCVSFAIIGISIGLLIGSFVSQLFIGYFNEGALLAGIWRIPFLLGLILSLSVLYLRHTSLNSNKKELRRHQSPWRETFLHYKRRILTVMVLQLVPAVSFNIIFIFMSSFLTQYLHQSMQFAVGMNIVAVILFMIAVPSFAILSDKIGRKPLLLFGSLSLVLFSIPLFLLFNTQNLFYIASALIFFVLIISIYYGAVTATMVELFPTHLRYTPIAIAHGLTFAIFAGTAPLISTIIIKWTGLIIAPSFYITLVSAIAFILIMSRLPETYHQKLN